MKYYSLILFCIFTSSKGTGENTIKFERYKKNRKMKVLKHFRILEPRHFMIYIYISCIFVSSNSSVIGKQCLTKAGPYVVSKKGGSCVLKVKFKR